MVISLKFINKLVRIQIFLIFLDIKNTYAIIF